MNLRSVAEKSAVVVSTVAASLVISCAGSEPGASPGQYDLADFQSLQWLQGEWRGSGGQQAFFEAYEQVNDSTIRIHYYADSTRSAERGTGSVYYSEGAIYHEADGASWVAVRLDETGIHFAPHERAQNSFRWTRLSAGAWEAVLRFEDGSEARYELTRIQP